MTVLVTETERVEIREFEVRDSKALSKILSDPDVMEYSSKGPLDEAGTKKFVESCRKTYEVHGYGLWAVIDKKSGSLIGYCGLSHATVDNLDKVEIAYRLAKEYWGLGIASETAAAVLAQGFDALNLELIVGIVSTRHKASIGVLEKIGFRDFYMTSYCGWDVRIYHLSKTQWDSLSAEH